jgi:cell division protein FtsZ
VTLQFEEDVANLRGANIVVVGVGGGGGNAVDRMIQAGVGGVNFIVANTDAQALRRSSAPVKIQIGSKITKGLGAGAKPEVGRQAALEDTNLLLEHLEGADMVFVTTGLGGGTGTGAAPIVASLAKELGALVVAVVTTPFGFEGPRRKRNAESGLQELKGSVDTVITISNDKLLSTVADKTPFTEAFRIADDVLRQAVQGISDLINVPGVINLDFADVKTIMEGMGVALMGSGTASGENRAVEASQRAISSPLLEEASILGAKGILLNIIGGPDLTMAEINEAATLIHQACDGDAEIIFGAVTDESMTGSVTVTVIATGFDTPSRNLSGSSESLGQNSVIKAFPGDHGPRTQARTTQNPQPPPHPTEHRVESRQSDRQDPRTSREFRPESTTTKRAEEPRQAVSSTQPTPEDAMQRVLLTPNTYGANNLGAQADDDLDIPTYLRNLRRMNSNG